MSIRKHVTVSEKFKLLDYYEKENVSARGLADNVPSRYVYYLYISNTANIADPHSGFPATK